MSEQSSKQSPSWAAVIGCAVIGFVVGGSLLSIVRKEAKTIRSQTEAVHQSASEVGAVDDEIPHSSDKPQQPIETVTVFNLGKDDLTVETRKATPSEQRRFDYLRQQVGRTAKSEPEPSSPVTANDVFYSVNSDGEYKIEFREGMSRAERIRALELRADMIRQKIAAVEAGLLGNSSP